MQVLLLPLLLPLLLFSQSNNILNLPAQPNQVQESRTSSSNAAQSASMQTGSTCTHQMPKNSTRATIVIFDEATNLVGKAGTINYLGK